MFTDLGNVLSLCSMIFHPKVEISEYEQQKVTSESNSGDWLVLLEPLTHNLTQSRK